MKRVVFSLVLLTCHMFSSPVWSQQKEGDTLRESLTFGYTDKAELSVLASVTMPRGNLQWYLMYQPERLQTAYWTLTMPYLIVGGLTTNSLSSLVYNPAGSSSIPVAGFTPAFSAECTAQFKGLVVGRTAGIFVLFDEASNSLLQPWASGFWLQARPISSSLIRIVGMYGGHERLTSDSWQSVNKAASFWSAVQISAKNQGFLFFTQESIRRGTDNSLGWLCRGYADFSVGASELEMSLAVSNGAYYDPGLVTEPLVDFSAKLRMAFLTSLSCAVWTKSTQKCVFCSPALMNGVSLAWSQAGGNLTLSLEEHNQEAIIYYLVRGSLGLNCSGGTDTDTILRNTLGASTISCKLSLYCKVSEWKVEEIKLTGALGIVGPVLCVVSIIPGWTNSDFELLLKQEMAIKLGGFAVKGSLVETTLKNDQTLTIKEYGISVTIKH